MSSGTSLRAPSEAAKATPTDTTRLAIERMLECAEAALRFAGDMSRDEFTSDLKTIYAVRAVLTLLGDAARDVPEAFCADHPGIPWSDLRRFARALGEAEGEGAPHRMRRATVQVLPSLRDQLRGLLRSI